MTYHQLTPGERYMLAALRRQGCTQSQVARELGRHRSTVCREVRRNRSMRRTTDVTFIAASLPWKNS